MYICKENTGNKYFFVDVSVWKWLMQLLWKLFLKTYFYIYIYTFSLSSVCTVLGRSSFFSSRPERSHGSTRVLDHAFLAWLSSFRVVVYISSQLGSSWQGNQVRYGKVRRYGPSITYKITPAASLPSSQPGGTPCWVSPLAFGLIVLDHGNSVARWPWPPPNNSKQAV